MESHCWQSINTIIGGGHQRRLLQLRVLTSIHGEKKEKGKGSGRKSTIKSGGTIKQAEGWGTNGKKAKWDTEKTIFLGILPRGGRSCADDTGTSKELTVCGTLGLKKLVNRDIPRNGQGNCLQQRKPACKGKADSVEKKSIGKTRG